MCASYYVILFMLACLLPFIMVVSTSFSESELIKEYGVNLVPRGWSLDAYKTIFIYPNEILNGYTRYNFSLNKVLIQDLLREGYDYPAVLSELRLVFSGTGVIYIDAMSLGNL